MRLSSLFLPLLPSYTFFALIKFLNETITWNTLKKENETTELCVCVHTHTPTALWPRIPPGSTLWFALPSSTVLIKQMSDTTSPLVSNQPFTPAYCAKCVWEKDYISRKALFITLSCFQVNPLPLFNTDEYFL